MLNEILEETKMLSLFAHPVNVTDQLLHVTRLILSVVEKRIDAYWGRFGAVAQPEMVKMLMRVGLSQEAATVRVLMTDLVEFRKSSLLSG